MGGALGGAERPGLGAELSGEETGNWSMEVLKAIGVAGAGAGLWSVSIVEMVGEGTGGREAEVIMGGGTGDTAGGKSGE